MKDQGIFVILDVGMGANERFIQVGPKKPERFSMGLG